LVNAVDAEERCPRGPAVRSVLGMSKTVVSPPAWVLPVGFVGLPLVGAGLGYLLKSIAGWVVSLPWAPFQGPFEALERIPEPYTSIGLPIVGGLAGLVLAVLVAWDLAKVTVTDASVTITRAGEDRTFPRERIGAVFVDGKYLVLLGPKGDELGRESVDLDKVKLTESFTEHGFPWREGDPYDADFRMWVLDSEGLPLGANALLRARERAVDHGDKSHANEIRAELGKLGVVVRDWNKRQYWRLTKGV
jgi:hypothetical protein